MVNDQTNAMAAGEDLVPHDAARGLSSPSFVGLLITQLLTSVNDNIFRWLAIGIGKDYVTPSNVGNILMAGTACFVLPYLVLAAPAGYLADRFSKRSVIVGCKIAEIAIDDTGQNILHSTLPSSRTSRRAYASGS